MLKILIIDDDPIVRTVLKRTLENQGYEVTTANHGEEGIQYARQIKPALIICDWMMSHLDGLEVCRRIKAESELATTFFILLTAKGAQRGEEEDRVRGLDAGADEFISKPIEMNELKARVRAGLRLYQLHEDLKRQKQALEALNQNLHTQKQILEAELLEASDYVQSLTPMPLTGEISSETLFIPSAQLGGDCFDYYWIDNENLVIYLLDVSGHGVGSALLSVSVLNLLRSQSLPNTNFRQPSEVLKSLNQTFQMNCHGDKYFTIWYGVYNHPKRQLVYASAGHPAGVLLYDNFEKLEVKHLGSLDLPIGFAPDIDFEEVEMNIVEGSHLYVYSDGAYEILQPGRHIWGVNAFVELLLSCRASRLSLQHLLAQIKKINFVNHFEDDLSILKINFN